MLLTSERGNALLQPVADNLNHVSGKKGLAQERGRASRDRGRFASLALVHLAILHNALGVRAQPPWTNNSAYPDYVPLRVTNNCRDTIWPGIGTQHGAGPGTGGFKLTPGMTMSLLVGPTWQGRIWGRTNCSFNADGTGPSNLNGWNGAGSACMTGDCFGQLNCEFSGATPCTLAEFNLRGGVTTSQTFYDISLVDGYNLPIGIVYIPAPNTTDIPPNLTNCACIATAGFLSPPSRTGGTYTNSSYPMPWEARQTNEMVGNWCPWDLQVFPPSKPGNGVYPYPDDNIQRPIFDPCFSACAATNDPWNCCTGYYNDPNICRPSLYSKMAKAVCPDAYSYAFDDQTSTFIIPAGGGWEVVFCPAGRSTNILKTFDHQLQALASSGHVSKEVLDAAKNVSYIMSHPGGGADSLRTMSTWALLVCVGTMVALAL